jgi:hypothetical protein
MHGDVIPSPSECVSGHPEFLNLLLPQRKTSLTRFVHALSDPRNSMHSLLNIAITILVEPYNQDNRYHKSSDGAKRLMKVATIPVFFLLRGSPNLIQVCMQRHAFRYFATHAKHTAKTCEISCDIPNSPPRLW